MANHQPDAIDLVQFMLPEVHYQTLSAWRQKSLISNATTQPTIVLAGLSEILAFFVHEIAFMESNSSYESGQSSLSLFLLNNSTDLACVQTRTIAAINLWLSMLYPDKPAAMRTAIADSAGDRKHWHSVNVSTRLNSHDGVCAVPEDAMLYRALLAMAASKLAGTKVSFASGETKTWIAQTPQSGTYGGIELVAFPPKSEPDGDGFFTEVVKLKTATFPERAAHGVHILAQPKIRNWGSVSGFDRSDSPARSLDLFVPRNNGEPSDYSAYSHTCIKFKARVINWDGVHNLGEQKRVEAQWEARRYKKVSEIVSSLAGINSLLNANFVRPILDDGGTWILPRLAPGSGDRNLAGGSGVGWGDRRDIVQAFDAPLSEMGFIRAGIMKRLVGQMPIKTDFSSGGSAEGRRKSLRATMRALGSPNKLTFLVLYIRDETLALIESGLIEQFGEPDYKDGCDFVWREGFRISLVYAPGGVFSRLLPEAHNLSAELEGMTDQQLAKIKADQQAQTNKAVEQDMNTHLEAHIGTVDGIGCAIVEMPDTIRGNKLDPYYYGRRVLAGHKLLPKVVLSEVEGTDEKYRASVADCIRMLGVVPFSNDDILLTPAAISIVQRNNDGNANSRGGKQSIPIAVRITSDQLEAALPNSAYEPIWKPYSRTVLSILRGDYVCSYRRRNDENMAFYAQFVCHVLEQLNQRGMATLVFLDGETLRRFIPSLQNGGLRLDNIEIRNFTYQPADLPNLRLVRINANAGELPSYFHNQDSQWTGGLFKWDNTLRTVYGAKKKPVTMQKGRALLQSRHDVEKEYSRYDREHRKSASLDEISIIFAQPGDDVLKIQLLAHRLRSQHTHFKDDTRLPFPLHELRTLIKSINS